MRAKDTSILKSFFSEFKELSYRKGDNIILANDEPNGVYLLNSGVVKMSHYDKKGTEFIANVFKPGTFFPMRWAIGEIENEYQYQAITPAKITRVPKERFTEFLEENPGVLFNLTKRIVIGLEGILFEMRHLLNGTSKTSTAVVLTMLAKRFGVANKKGEIELTVKFTHQDIASFAGMTRESATLAINQLEKEKIVKQVKRKIIILDLSKLENVFDA